MNFWGISMSKNNRLPTNQEIAQYIDCDMPLKQLEHDLLMAEDLQLLDSNNFEGLSDKYHNGTDDLLEAHDNLIQENDRENQTFIYAQLAYAKFKHSKQAKQKQKAYKNRWIKRGLIDD